MSKEIIPTLDISGFTSGMDPDSIEVANVVNKACEEIGFLIIKGHGVPDDVVGKLSSCARNLFDLPDDVKNQYQATGDVYSGYKALKHAALAYSLDDVNAKPDLREKFSCGRPDIEQLDDPYFHSAYAANFCHPVKWPAEIEGFRQAWSDYYEAMATLSDKIMRIFAVGLGLNVDYFDNMLNKHVSNMVVYNYPEQTEEPEDGQLRGGAHTDFGSLTIVHADWNQPGGLQVFTKDEKWIDVPAEPGTFVINIGDMMERWTNDQWVSTLHRVANPPADAAASSRRQSIIFFHIPNYDATVECIPTCMSDSQPAKYDPISVGDHHLMKMGKMHKVDK